MELEDKPEKTEKASDFDGILPQGITADTFKTDAASNLKFQMIVRFFNKFGDSKGKEKTKLARTFVTMLIKDNRKPAFTYNILRLLLPSEDRDRGNYGIKEKTLATIIKEALGLSKEDFEKMRHYRNPSFHSQGIGVGDFPSIVYSITSKYCKKQSTITVQQVNKILDELVLKTDLTDQIAVFTQFLKVCTAEQLKWIIRVILKDLKLNIKTEVIFGSLHKDAQDYYNLTNSIKEVCKKFQDKNISLSNELILFQPIKSMLAGKKPLDYFDSQQKEYLLQTKFDGQRLQVHINGDTIKMFSRNGKDYTHIYKQLLPIFKSNINADACIIDGQVLVLQKQTLNMVPFGMNKQVALGNDTSSKLQICYKVFDTLWIRYQSEEANLMAIPLRKRKGIMDKFIKEEKGRLEIVRGEMVMGTEIITKKFYQSIQRNQEGVILKDPDSLYVPNDRSINWIKLKGDYVEGLTDTLDLLIIGGYYGGSSCRTTGTQWTDRIYTFLLGVITYLDRANPRSSHVIPFCKVGTGYSQSALNQLRQKLRKAWIKNDGRTPSYIVGNWKPKLDDKPDCFIDSPANSVILQVKAAEMIKSDAFAAEKTLRFPRVVKIRYDKDWWEGLKMEELQDLMSGEKYTKGIKKRERRREDGDSEDGEQPEGSVKSHRKSAKESDKTRKSNKAKDVLKWFKGVDFNQKDIISTIFAGQQFMVLNLHNQYQKPLLERKILQNGGSIVQNPVSTTKYIITQILDFRFRTLALCAASSHFTFIKPIYIQSCIAQSRMLPLSPIYLTIIPRQKSSFYHTRFDMYGDSYTDFLNLRQLDYILAGMQFYEEQIDSKLVKRIGAGIQEKLVYAEGLDLRQRVGLRMRGYRLLEELTHGVKTAVLPRGSDVSGFPSGIAIQYIEDLQRELNFQL